MAFVREPLRELVHVEVRFAGGAVDRGVDGLSLHLLDGGVVVAHALLGRAHLPAHLDALAKVAAHAARHGVALGGAGQGLVAAAVLLEQLVAVGKAAGGHDHGAGVHNNGRAVLCGAPHARHAPVFVADKGVGVGFGQEAHVVEGLGLGGEPVGEVDAALGVVAVRVLVEEHDARRPAGSAQPPQDAVGRNRAAYLVHEPVDLFGAVFDKLAHELCVGTVAVVAHGVVEGLHGGLDLVAHAGVLGGLAVEGVVGLDAVQAAAQKAQLLDGDDVHAQVAALDDGAHARAAGADDRQVAGVLHGIAGRGGKLLVSFLVGDGRGCRPRGGQGGEAQGCALNECSAVEFHGGFSFFPFGA